MVNLDSSQHAVVELLQAKFDSLAEDFPQSVNIDVNSDRERNLNLTKKSDKPTIMRYLKAVALVVAHLVNGKEAHDDFPTGNKRACIEFPNGQRITFSWEDWRDVKRFHTALGSIKNNCSAIPKSNMHIGSTSSTFSIARKPYALILNICTRYQTATDIQADFQASYLEKQLKEVKGWFSLLSGVPVTPYLVPTSSLSTLASAIQKGEYINLFNSYGVTDPNDDLTNISITFDGNQFVVSISSKTHSLPLIDLLIKQAEYVEINKDGRNTMAYQFKLPPSKFTLLNDIFPLIGISNEPNTQAA